MTAFLSRTLFQAVTLCRHKLDNLSTLTRLQQSKTLEHSRAQQSCWFDADAHRLNVQFQGMGAFHGHERGLDELDETCVLWPTCRDNCPRHPLIATDAPKHQMNGRWTHAIFASMATWLWWHGLVHMLERRAALCHASPSLSSSVLNDVGSSLS